MTSKRSAEELIRPLVARINSCFIRAWSEYRKDYKEHIPKHTRTTRANLVRDHAVEHIKRELDGLPGVSLITRGQLFLVGIAGKLLLRIKKLERGGKSKNIPTEQALRFVGQQAPFDAPGFRRATNVDVGYELDGLGQVISRIFAACPDGRKIAWVITLLDNAAGEQLELPDSIPRSPKVTPIRVRAKKPKTNEGA